jgi:CheY-like chemotaxis protein
MRLTSDLFAYMKIAVNSKRSGTSTSPARILLAEDDPPNRKVTQLMLRRLGYEADSVTNGLEVLQALEEQPYDLVHMDILMPKMDGVATAEEIRRRWPASRQPRIIAYTAYILPDNGCQNLKNMDGYLFKPVKMDDLRTAIEGNLRVLDRQRNSATRWAETDTPQCL